MKLPIDTSVLTFMCSLPPKPVINGQTKLPKADADGQPLHSVELASFGPEGAQVLVVKFGGSPPAGVIPGASVSATKLQPAGSTGTPNAGMGSSPLAGSTGNPSR